MSYKVRTCIPQQPASPTADRFQTVQSDANAERLRCAHRRCSPRLRGQVAGHAKPLPRVPQHTISSHPNDNLHLSQECGSEASSGQLRSKTERRGLDTPGRVPTKEKWLCITQDDEVLAVPGVEWRSRWSAWRDRSRQSWIRVGQLHFTNGELSIGV